MLTVRDALADLLESRRLDISTGNEYNTNLMKRWMTSCSSHELCQQRRASRKIKLPTRVIDVGDDQTDPRLVIGSGTAEYACLSHCWGGSQPLTTTKATLADRLAGIRLEQMPKTFRDAIIVARQLDLRYLWIDSLCIIQDSADDWSKESAEMGRICQ